MMDMEAAGAATQGDRGFVGAGREVESAPIWDEDTLDPKIVHEYLTALARDDAARDHLRGHWLLKGLLSRVWVPGDATRENPAGHARVRFGLAASRALEI